jgi:hypothetical protein
VSVGPGERCRFVATTSLAASGCVKAGTIILEAARGDLKDNARPMELY